MLIGGRQAHFFRSVSSRPLSSHSKLDSPTGGATSYFDEWLHAFWLGSFGDVR